MIWDTAGQERFASLSNAFFRGADACILVFDSTKSPKYNNLKYWLETFISLAPVNENDLNNFCFISVGNKLDKVDDIDSFNFNDHLNDLKSIYANSSQFNSPYSILKSLPKFIPKKKYSIPNNVNSQNYRQTIYYTPVSSLESSIKNINKLDDHSSIHSIHSNHSNISTFDYNQNVSQESNENLESENNNIIIDSGLKLFWASAKTGHGINDIFE